MKALTLSCALLALAAAPVLTAQDSPAPAPAPAADPLPMPAPAPAKPPLELLETHYAADRAASLRRVLARYVDELEALESSLIASGDAPGAARVRLERDRVLPALGLPTVAAEDASEFAAFEDPAEMPVPPAPVVLPGDLDAILKSLQPGIPDQATPSTAATTTPAGRSLPAVGKDVRRNLRMTNAQLGGTYDPLYPWQYWTYGRSASWTLNDLPPGSYQVVLRYTCDDSLGGGKLKVKLGNTTLEADVAPTGSWKRRRELVIGPFPVTGSRADLILSAASILPNASYLMDLNVLAVSAGRGFLQAMTLTDPPLALITGGGGTLAGAIASVLHEAGWDVRAPRRAELDVTDAEQVKCYVAALPKIDLLINNAGLRRDVPFLKLPESAWDEVIQTNLKGAWLVSRAVLPIMRQQGHGHLIQISSYTARHGVAGQAAYGAAKAGLLGLTQSLAAEAGRYNIRVNAILPGWMPTRFNQDLPPAHHEAARAQHHLARFNTPEATARFILSLHQHLPHTSGQVFQLDSRPGTWV